MKQRRIIILGYMGSCPIAGIIWQHLHYIVGLQRLGHEVYYIEDSVWPCLSGPEPDASYGEDYTYAVATLRDLAEAFGFQSHWAYCARFLNPPKSFGLDLYRIRQLYGEADAILNISGAQEVNEDLLGNDRLIFVESDPGVDQIKVDQSDSERRDFLGHHRVLFTFGENVGDSSFPVPLHELKWLSTRQPVVTEFWKTASKPAQHAVFTTVANWSTLGTKDVKWNGETFTWSKPENFLKFADAPQAIGQTIELATDIKDPFTAEIFHSKGWRLTSPYILSADRELYRQFILNSRGEFTAAKDVYVRLNTGWFSDRSACYLAAARPVITQNTGFTRLYGGNLGLFAFSDLNEVAEAAAAIRADYAAHSRAAYEIACEFFEAGKVLASLLERAGV